MSSGSLSIATAFGKLFTKEKDRLMSVSQLWEINWSWLGREQLWVICPSRLRSELTGTEDLQNNLKNMKPFISYGGRRNL